MSNTIEIYCPVFNVHNMDFNQLYVLDIVYTEKDAIKSLKTAIIEKLIRFTYGPEPTENDDISIRLNQTCKYSRRISGCFKT